MNGENQLISSEAEPRARRHRSFDTENEDFMVNPDDELKAQNIYPFEIDQSHSGHPDNSDLSISKELCAKVLDAAGYMKAISLCSFLLSVVFASKGALMLYYALPFAVTGTIAGYRLSKVFTILFILYLFAETALKIEFLFERSALETPLAVCVLVLNFIFLCVSLSYLMNLCRVPREDSLKLVRSKRFFEGNEYQMA